MASVIRLAALSYVDALTLVSEVLRVGDELGSAFAVTVVDPSLRVLAAAQANAANPTASETSRRAANTAIADDRPTGWMPEAFQVIVPLSTGNVSTNMPGGFPVHVSGDLVAGLGVAGGDGDHVAEAVRRALAVVGADSTDRAES